MGFSDLQIRTRFQQSSFWTLLREEVVQVASSLKETRRWGVVTSRALAILSRSRLRHHYPLHHPVEPLPRQVHSIQHVGVELVDIVLLIPIRFQGCPCPPPQRPVPLADGRREVDRQRAVEAGGET